MGELLVFMGALTIIWSVFDIWDVSNGDKNWKAPVIKIVGGLVIAGIGAAFKYFSL